MEGVVRLEKGTKGEKGDSKSVKNVNFGGDCAMEMLVAA